MKKLRFYSAVKTILGPVLKLFMRIHVKGSENEYTGDGGCVVCTNHTHFFDCVVLVIAFKVLQIRFLAKKELFSVPILKNIIKGFGAFGLDRGGQDVGALKKTIQMLSDGAVVGIFPQGTRQPGKEIADTKFKSGAAMAAYHAKVPVQPVLIKVKDKRYRLFRKKEVIIGAPISWKELGFSEGAHADYAKATEIIKEKICALEKEQINKVE